MADKKENNEAVSPAVTDAEKYWLLAVTDRGVNMWSFDAPEECAEQYAAIYSDDMTAQLFMFFGRRFDIKLDQYASVSISDPKNDKFDLKYDVKTK